MEQLIQAKLPMIMDVANSLLGWMLFSAAMWTVLGKLGVGKRWRAWIPGLRYVAIGEALDMSDEGFVCALFELLSIGASFLNTDVFSERVRLAAELALVVVFVFLAVYRIRLVLRLLKVFDMNKRWILLWLVADWLLLLIVGRSSKFQPVILPGAPAGPALAEHHGMFNAESGLSVDLRSRTVLERYKKRYLLRDISLDIPNGSLVLLLGGSGAGKTTFVNAINGYEQAKAEILLNGTNMYTQYGKMKYDVGFVPQSDMMRGKDTVLATLLDAAKLRLPKDVDARQRRARVEEVMEIFGLTPVQDHLIEKLSGGQRKRLSISMEFISNPSLFILDEPDSGLDGVMARELFVQLRRIADSGKIVIAITHTPDRVIDLFDDVIILAKDSARTGRLAWYGSVEGARQFFGRERMEEIVKAVNRKEEGGEGLADEFVMRYAEVQHG